MLQAAYQVPAHRLGNMWGALRIMPHLPLHHAHLPVQFSELAVRDREGIICIAATAGPAAEWLGLHEHNQHRGAA